tara:strand:- start:188 stop:448 length:261 start_codon:yes stop_codon:yes gene_type:complete
MSTIKSTKKVFFCSRAADFDQEEVTRTIVLVLSCGQKNTRLPPGTLKLFWLDSLPPHPDSRSHHADSDHQQPDVNPKGLKVVGHWL